MRKTVERRLLSLKRRFRPDLAGKLTQPQSLRKAAQCFGLDPKDPAQRDLLLFALAEAAFGKERPGRPKGRRAWGRYRLYELARLYEKYRDAGFRGDKKIAEAIHSDHKKEFGSSAEAIRRWLPYARWVREELLEEAMWEDHMEPPEGWNEDDGDRPPG
jgi:hypothetical protein